MEPHTPTGVYIWARVCPTQTGYTRLQHEPA
jgi:hypothetical protein